MIDPMSRTGGRAADPDPSRGGSGTVPRYSKFDDNPLQTRADFQRCVRDLFEPLVPRLAADGAAIDFDEGGAHYDMRAASLEGVARPLWGIVPLTAGGGAFDHWPLLRAAIAEGTDPEHPRFWGYPGDVDQRSCEMAAFAWMLLLVPQEGWAPFDARQKDNLVRWLARIQGPQMPQNNWLFFTVLVQQALKAVGRADLVDTALEADRLARLEHWYRGDGWYGDGGSGTIDHYGGFAMHFYGLVYARFAPDPDPCLARLFRERAETFAEPFSRWFADTGESMAQGRSLTYRFATAAFWGILAAVGLEPLPIGRIKGLWARHLRSWRGKPIFTADGLLTRGYDYPNLVICEEYNSPTSPYWAMKFFAPLMLAEDDAFWRAAEEPLVFAEPIVAQPACPAIVQRVDGHAVVHYAAPVHRKVQADKYNKFAYSTRFGFDVDALRCAEMGRFGDNILAFSHDGGANWAMRLHNDQAEIDARGRLRALWHTGFQKVETTISVLADGLSVRRHRFTLERPALVVDTGFAVDRWYEEAEVLVPGASELGGEARVGATVVVRGADGISAVCSLDHHAKVPCFQGRVHSNPVAARTGVPFLSLSLPAGDHCLIDAFGVSPAARRCLADRLFDLDGVAFA